MRKPNTMRVMIGMMCVTAMMSTTAFAAVGTPGLQVYTPGSKADSAAKLDQAKEAGAYTTISGVVSDVTDKGDYYTISMDNDDMGMVFHAKKDRFVLDQKTGELASFSDLKKGTAITAVLAKNSPMTMSLPPQTSGALGFVVNAEPGQSAVGVFNDELVNQDNTLKLNISEDTKIISSNRNKMKYTAEDLKQKECLVLYTATTRSIPAQTTPELVMILEAPAQDSSENESGEEQKEDSYVELRSGAEAKGYKIEWVSNQKPLVLTKDNMKIELSFNSEKFTFTHTTKDIKALDRIEKMNLPVKLVNGKTMISAQFLEMME